MIGFEGSESMGIMLFGVTTCLAKGAPHTVCGQEPGLLSSCHLYGFPSDQIPSFGVL